MGIWAVGGYYIYEYRHQMLSRLGRLFNTFPEAGEERPEKANSFIAPALERIDPSYGNRSCKENAKACEDLRRQAIRLDLMEKACGSSVVEMYSYYKTDWLTELREWNLTPYEEMLRKGKITMGDTAVSNIYWKTNQNVVLESLKDLINASSYAFEVRADVSGTRDIYVAEEIAKLARAVCREDIAVLAWGDYVSFLEARAFRKITTDDPSFSSDYQLPMEQEIFVLDSLKDNERYIAALLSYLNGAPAPGPNTLCADQRFRLSCAAPLEAEKVYKKLLYALPASYLPPTYYKIAQLQLYLSREGYPDRHRKSLDSLAGAVIGPDIEYQARLLITAILLEEKLYEQALDQLKTCAKLTQDQGLTDSEFRALAQRTLMGLGRFPEADCYSDLANSSLGERKVCEALKL